MVIATAQEQAALADQVACTAEKDSAKAKKAAQRASTYAQKAGQFAADAKESAKNATASAQKAEVSARTAQAAAQRAQTSARQADDVSVWSQVSTQRAYDYAAGAREAESEARRAALAAGKNYQAANSDAQIAWNTAVRKQQEEELAAYRARLEAEQIARQAAEQRARQEAGQRSRLDNEKKGGLSWGHVILDAIGVFDPIGVSDGLNAVWYAAEGDKTNAGISLGCMIPVVGGLGVGVRAGKTALKAGEQTVLKATNSAGLSADIVRLAERNITSSGDTVLGHFPGYINKANARGASYYDIGDAWNGLTDEQRWAANSHFLDTRIAAGERVLLSLPKTEIRPGSYLAREVQYLTDNGYRWVNQWALRPGG